MDDEFDIIMIEISFHLLTIDIVDVQISHSQAALPLLVAMSKLWVFDVKDTVHDGEVIFNLLVAFDMKSSMSSFALCLNDGCLEVRHLVEDESGW